MAVISVDLTAVLPIDMGVIITNIATKNATVLTVQRFVVSLTCKISTVCQKDYQSKIVRKRKGDSMKIDIDLFSQEKIIGDHNLTKGLWKVDSRDIVVIVCKDNPQTIRFSIQTCPDSGKPFNGINDEIITLDLEGNLWNVPESWDRFTYTKVSGTIAFTA